MAKQVVLHFPSCLVGRKQKRLRNVMLQNDNMLKRFYCEKKKEMLFLNFGLTLNDCGNVFFNLFFHFHLYLYVNCKW